MEREARWKRQGTRHIFALIHFKNISLVLNWWKVLSERNLNLWTNFWSAPELLFIEFSLLNIDTVVWLTERGICTYISSVLHPLSWTNLLFLPEAPEVELSSCDSTQKISFASCWEQVVGIEANETGRPQSVLCVLGWNDVWKMMFASVGTRSVLHLQEIRDKSWLTQEDGTKL